VSATGFALPFATRDLASRWSDERGSSSGFVAALPKATGQGLGSRSRTRLFRPPKATGRSPTSRWGDLSRSRLAGVAGLHELEQLEAADTADRLGHLARLHRLDDVGERRWYLIDAAPAQIAALEGVLAVSPLAIAVVWYDRSVTAGRVSRVDVWTGENGRIKPGG